MLIPGAQVYQKIKKTLPKIGKRVMTRSGEGKVIRQNILKESFSVLLDSGDEVEVNASDLVREGFFKKKQKRGKE